MPHSDEMREFRFTDRGIDILPGAADGRAGADMADETFDLRLYVAGQTPKAIRAFANLRKICDEHLAGRYSIEVIDLLERSAARSRRPDSGAADAGPPAAEPIKKIIGDLSNTERVLVGLDLRPRQR